MDRSPYLVLFFMQISCVTAIRRLPEIEKVKAQASEEKAEVKVVSKWDNQYTFWDRISDYVHAINGFLSSTIGIKDDEVDVSMNDGKVLLIVAALITTIIFASCLMKHNIENAKVKYFMQGSGLSTSSSNDARSSEDASTDKELKSRMNRFQQRLVEHQKRLEELESLDEVNKPSSSDAAFPMSQAMKAAVTTTAGYLKKP